jgi:hypothetical protein
MLAALVAAFNRRHGSLISRNLVHRLSRKPRKRLIRGIPAQVKLDDSSFGAVAGHWFWRDPSQMLIGIYVS